MFPNPNYIRLPWYITIPIINVNLTTIRWTIIVGILLFAITLTILAATHVAELISASTGHVAASLVFRYPKFTLRALFVLCSFNKIQELPVLLWKIHHFPVFLTCSVWMRLCFALQTVTFWTFWAVQDRYILIKFKSIRTPRGRAPGHVLWVFINKIMQSKLVVLFH